MDAHLEEARRAIVAQQAYARRLQDAPNDLIGRLAGVILDLQDIALDLIALVVVLENKVERLEATVAQQTDGGRAPAAH